MKPEQTPHPPEKRFESHIARTERHVVVDNAYLGMELKRFFLSVFSKKNIEQGAGGLVGGDRFNEIFFETESGDLYHIQQINGRWTLSKKSAEPNQPQKDIMLTEDELEQGVIAVGEPFEFGLTVTPRVIHITAVNTKRIYPPKALQDLTGGVTGDLVERFHGDAARDQTA